MFLWFYDYRRIVIEVPHFASLRGKEREIKILRSDNGEKWEEHPIAATDDAVNKALNESMEGTVNTHVLVAVGPKQNYRLFSVTFSTKVRGLSRSTMLSWFQSQHYVYIVLKK